MSGEKALWPIDVKGRQGIQNVLDTLAGIDNLIGGWTSSADARQTGLTLHIKFDRKTDVMTGTMVFGNVLERSPAMLGDACRRLLAAMDATEADTAAAARLRSLAAIYEQPLNRDKTFTFTGRELAAMLKEEG